MLADFMTYAPLPLVLAVVWALAMGAIAAAGFAAYHVGHVVYETYLEEV